MRHFMGSFSLRASTRSNEISPCLSEKARLSMKWAMLFAFLLPLMGCSGSSPNSASAGNTPSTFKKLSPSQLSLWEDTVVDGLGRYEKMTLPAATGDDSILVQMRTALASPTCVLSDALHGKTTPQKVLSISGAHCVFQAYVQSKSSITETKLVGSWSLSDKTLLPLNRVASFGYSGKGTWASAAKFKVLSFRLNGNIYLDDKTRLDLSLETNLKFSTTTTPAALISGTRVHHFTLGTGMVTLKMEKEETAALPTYWLDDNQITAELYNTYLSRLGSIVSGALIEAG